MEKKKKEFKDMKKTTVVSSDGKYVDQVENTPFAIYTETDKGSKIVMGNYMISSKTFETYQEAKDYIDSKPWELIINAAAAILKLAENEKTGQTSN